MKRKFSDPRLLIVLLHLVATQSVRGQIQIGSNDFPQRLGEFQSFYYADNVPDAASLIGSNGGPFYWDFSQLQVPNEEIRHMLIVDPSTGAGNEAFPAATYAEQITIESNPILSWRYFSFDDSGRNLHGFHDARINALAPRVVFQEPARDFPNVLNLGSTWTWGTAYSSVEPMSTFEFDVYQESVSIVNAYGILKLPQIGDLPVVRVQENIHQTLVIFETPFELYFTNYIWLVRGIGVAAQVMEFDYNSPFSGMVPSTNFVQRVFKTFPRTVDNLQIRITEQTVQLYWSSNANSSGYRIQSADNLSSVAWQQLGETETNSWLQPISSGDRLRFFRVLLKP